MTKAGGKVVALVQARMGSRRFPGKMTQRLGPYPLIRWVLERVRRCRRVDEAVLATSTDPANDVLEREARDLGLSAYRGAEEDVLDRFLRAASAHGAGHVVRVCADNPFVAPEEVDRLVDFYRREGPDYAFNHVPRMDNRYPDGLGAEMLSFPLLKQLGRLAAEPRHREHATLYLWDHADQFRLATFPAPTDIAGPEVKLDVDRPEDLERLSRLPCAADIGAPARVVVRDYKALYGGEKKT